VPKAKPVQFRPTVKELIMELNNMDINFSAMQCDQIEKLDKRLESLKKSFIKEYVTVLNAINDETEIEHRSETKIEIDDILNDTANKASIVYRQGMIAVQKVLTKYL
jgi:hypothetical protein